MRLAIFASGGGSNFQAIANACRNGTLHAKIVLCVASRPDAGVIDRARSLDIPVHVLTAGAEELEDEMLRVLNEANADFIALAGFMRLIPAGVVRAFRNRILNIHPALLPDFGGKGMYGRRVHEAVIESGAMRSGATVHLVDEEYDTGAIVLQESIEVRPNDTPESLAARVLEVEHRIYPKAVGLFADDRVRIDGRTVTILSES